MQTILVIDDDFEVQRVLRRTFEPAGYDLFSVTDGAVAMNVFRDTKPQLVILDLCLPGKSGQDLCREIREESVSVPILVLTAVADEAEKVKLLRLGADDYLMKPFSPRELLARTRAAMRRVNESSRNGDLFRFDGIEVNLSAMQLYRRGMNVRLTNQECKLLRVLLNNPNCTISLPELLNEAWNGRARRTAHSIRTQIYLLRQKLESNPSRPLHLVTVNRMGYRFAP